jgi:hypothetical protein
MCSCVATVPITASKPAEFTSDIEGLTRVESVFNAFFTENGRGIKYFVALAGVSEWQIPL